jgi:hypothetical protein
LRSFWKSAVLLLSMAASATFVSAQNHPMPSAVTDPPVICTGCPGNNSAGEVNDGKPTFPYDSPISVHVGRFVDSSSTNSVLPGMRTLRSGIVRVAPASLNRIYLQLGATLGAYTLDTFFTGKLTQPMVALNTLPAPNGAKAPFSGRSPFEKLAKWDRYFYPEATANGWSTPAVDMFDVLRDFDADDRGNVYLGMDPWGWGIVSDPGGENGSLLPAVIQVTNTENASSLLSLRSGSSYHVYYSNGSDWSRLYDVTSVSAPAFIIKRNGSTNAFRRWSKFDAGARVALLNGDGLVRVYSYPDLISGAAPLITVTPAGGKIFGDLSFDDDGNLWLAERNSGSSTTTNALYKLSPSGDTYTTSMLFVYGSEFSPSKIHAAAGYIAVAGVGLNGAGSQSGFELRLLRVIDGTPVLLDTNNFFRRYYHRAETGFAQPWIFTTLGEVRIVAQGTKTYLFYSAWGLGDVYELGDGPRVTSVTPLTGTPLGGTNVDLYGTGFVPGATIAFDGITTSSSFVSDTHMTATSPAHAAGSVSVVVSRPDATPLTAPQPFVYELAAPQHFSALAPNESSVDLSWTGVALATRYQVERRFITADLWTVIGTPTGTTFVDEGRTPETTYVYRVRAGDASAFSNQGAIDLATTMTTEASVITVGAPILGFDMTKLRKRVSSVRAASGLPMLSTATSGTILAQDITQLRTALTEARRRLGFTTPAFTDPTIVPGVTTVKAVHWNELLDLMR